MMLPIVDKSAPIFEIKKRPILTYNQVFSIRVYDKKGRMVDVLKGNGHGMYLNALDKAKKDANTNNGCVEIRIRSNANNQ